MEYIQLTQINKLPDIKRYAPFKAVLVIENQVNEHRQKNICDWLIEMGGLYVMICSTETKSWNKSVRQANLDKTDIQNMRPDQFVMITNHQQEQIRYVFWHAKQHSEHTHVKLKNIVVVHVAKENRKTAYLSIFNSLMKT